MLSILISLLLFQLDKLFHEGDRYHIETSRLICRAKRDWFVYDRGLRHGKVKKLFFF